MSHHSQTAYRVCGCACALQIGYNKAMKAEAMADKNRDDEDTYMNADIKRLTHNNTKDTRISSTSTSSGHSVSINGIYHDVTNDDIINGTVTIMMVVVK
jgi:hypothetical protein